MTVNGPTSCQNAALKHDGMESGSADTIQHQGLLLLLFLSTNGPVTNVLYIMDPRDYGCPLMWLDLYMCEAACCCIFLLC